MSTHPGDPVLQADHLPCRRRRPEEASRVRDLLRVEIVSGRYSEQDQLPSEPELMLEYGAGRNVIRDSLDLLRIENLIQRIQGSGTFVLATKAQHRLDRVHAIQDSVRRCNEVTGEVVSMMEVVAPRLVAEHLALAAGGRCTVTEYTAAVAGAPFSTSVSYLPTHLGRQLDPGTFAGDFYQWLETAGCVLDGGELSVEAILADGEAARTLAVSVGSPLVMFRRRLVAPDDSPLEFGFVRCRGDRLSLNIGLPRALKENEQ